MDRLDETVIPPQTAWLNDPAAQSVCAAIRGGGYSVYFVGGCVRDALLGVSGGDVDLSTNAHPDDVMRLADAAGLRALPTGIDHGTITVIAQGKPFEVTTFRRDVETDGRRAVVAFSDDIADDARRRDFTMNALYASIEGDVIDPLGGLPDLRARKVRFIEDATARIREDYLRILRFFRFSAWYADPDAGFDPDTLAAIASNIDGLETLSAERVGVEMRKLLSAPDPAPAVAVMRQCGVLGVALPCSDDRWLAPLIHLQGTSGVMTYWMTRLVALGGQEVADRLRLSRAEARHIDILRDVGFAGPSLPEVAYRYGVDVARQALLLRAIVAENEPDLSVLEPIEAAGAAVFPVQAKDLMPELQGPELGARLKELEKIWIASGFVMTREDLLSHP